MNREEDSIWPTNRPCVPHKSEDYRKLDWTEFRSQLYTAPRIYAVIPGEMRNVRGLPTKKRFS